MLGLPLQVAVLPLRNARRELWVLQRRLRGGAGRGSKRPASGQRSVRGDGPPQQRNRPAAPEAAPPAADPSDEDEDEDFEPAEENDDDDDDDDEEDDGGIGIVCVVVVGGRTCWPAEDC